MINFRSTFQGFTYDFQQKETQVNLKELLKIDERCQASLIIGMVYNNLAVETSQYLRFYPRNSQYQIVTKLTYYTALHLCYGANP